MSRTASFQVQLPLPRRKAAASLRQQFMEYLSSQPLAVGQKLLSDAELMQVSGLSRRSVRIALEDLARDGWIERRHGRGTFVGPRAALSAPVVRQSGEAARSRVGRLAVLVHMPRRFQVDWYSTGVFEGMDAAAAEHQIGVELIGGHDRTNDDLLNRLQRTRPDVLACLSPKLMYALVIARSIQMGIPVLLTGSRLSELELPAVCEDGVQGARLAVEHLVARGHRRIGFIQTQVPARWGFERRRGYQEGLINAGIEPEENLIYWMADGDDGCEPLEWIETYLRREKPTAVIAANFGAMRHLGRLVTKRGIKVPQHLSVVTFDQCWEMTPWTGGVRPTTVALPLKQMGERLVKMAAEVLAGHTLPGGAESIACSLLEGDSVLSI